MDTATSVVSSPSSTALAATPTVAHTSTEVPGKATCGRFTLKYKRKIVTLTMGLPSGDVGALLRRRAVLLASDALAAANGGVGRKDAGTAPWRKPDPRRPERLKIEQLERDLARAQKRLLQTEAIIDAQKKLCALGGDRDGGCGLDNLR